MTLLYAILLALLIHALRRQLRTMAAYVVLGAALYALWVIAPDLGTTRMAILGFYGMVLLSIIVGPWLAYRLIVAWHVNQDRRRAHERVDQEMDKRLP